MAPSAARLERLRKLVQSDLDALPDRNLCRQPEPDSVSDDDAAGGVSLEDTSSKQSPAAPNTTSAPALEDPAPAPNVLPPQKAVDPSEENPDRRFLWKQGAASSYNLGSKPKLSALPITPSKLASTTLEKGQLAHSKKFTPIVALSKYPYKFCNQSCMQDIASAFFDAGKFWAREWDLYYVWDIDEIKPLILIGETQFEDLLKEINSSLKLGLRITNQQREDGLVSRFPDHPRCQPRYLGRSHSKEEYEIMTGNVPGAITRPSGESAHPPMDNRTLEDFKQMIEEMWDLTKAKGKAAKEKKKVDRMNKNKVFADQFKRAQRYLGLRPTAQENSMQNPAGLPPAIDATAPAPFAFDQSVVFVCVDVESYEKAHHKITEIGVATLDTRDLAGVAPGLNGEHWRSKIRARHFRIRDNAHLVNQEFVTGCPDRFDFGTSEWVRLIDAPDEVAACFKPPFCARSDQAVDGIVIMLDTIDLGESRKLIFLGHDTLGDVKYLQQLGFDPLTLPNLVEAQDTATMYRVWHRDQQPTKLGNILYDFDIAGFNLHNAGNDAVFTVQAMLGICVREASIRGSAEMKDIRNEQKATRFAAAQLEAKERAEDDTAGWSDHEADGDGGAPTPIVIKETMNASPAPSQIRAPTAFNPTSPTAGGGRGGRGRGGWRGRGQNGGYRSQDSSSTSSSRGDYRNPGRYQTNGASSGRGRGRGRARGSPTTSRQSSESGFETPQPDVKYYW